MATIVTGGMVLTQDWKRLAHGLLSQARDAIKARDLERADDLLQDVQDIFIGTPGRTETHREKPPGMYLPERVR